MNITPHLPRFSKKRHLILLEVLIAFALIALCLLPMIYPQVYIIKSEREFIETIELDHIVNLLYADRLQKMYLNEINWSEIVEGKPTAITEEMLRDIGYQKELAYKGEYQFTILKRKPPPPDDRLYLVKLVFAFTHETFVSSSTQSQKEISPPPKKLAYEYQIFIERRPKHVEEGEINGKGKKIGHAEEAKT